MVKMLKINAGDFMEIVAAIMSGDKSRVDRSLEKLQVDDVVITNLDDALEYIDGRFVDFSGRVIHLMNRISELADRVSVLESLCDDGRVS